MRQNPTHTSSLRKAGKRGIRERRREEREGAKRAGTGGLGAGATHPPGWESSERPGCFSEEKNRSSPLHCVPSAGNYGVVSPHTLLLSLPTACWQAPSLRALIHKALCIHQARSFCDTSESSPKCPLHTHAHTCTHTRTYLYTHTHIYSYTYTYTCTHIHTCIYTETYTHMYTHANIYTCIYTYTHTHTQPLPGQVPLPLWPPCLPRTP